MELDKSSFPSLPAANGDDSRIDKEAAPENSKELRRKKNMTWWLYLVVFAIFQTSIILLFVLIIMKLRTPKFRVLSATFDNFNVGLTPSNPTFDLRMNVQVGVKNTNLGDFKYQNSTIHFFYRGTPIGEAFIERAGVGWRTTRKFSLVVNLSSSTLPANSLELGNDLSRKLLPLTSQSNLKGKVELIKVFKKDKSTDLNCSMEVVIATQELSNIVCK